MDARIAAKNALINVIEAVPGERIVVVCDDKLKDIGNAFAEGALDMGLWTRLVILNTEGIRKEIPSHLQEIFTSQQPDIFINLLRGSSEETPFRIKVTNLETRKRARLGHCPGVNLEMLTEGALALESEEYKRMQIFADMLMQKLEKTETVHLTNPAGTDVTLSVANRDFFTDTKIDWKQLKWMNLPVGEVCVGPVETSMNGKLICDMGIGGVGKLDDSATLSIEVKEGKVVKVNCENKEVLARVLDALATDAWASHVGEFAFGINKKARFSEEFLEAEKIFGTCHIAFGNNADFPGGKNNSMHHMDFLISKPTVEMNLEGGKIMTIMKNGEFLL